MEKSDFILGSLSVILTGALAIIAHKVIKNEKKHIKAMNEYSEIIKEHTKTNEEVIELLKEQDKKREEQEKED